MDELKYLTAFRALAEKIDYLESTNATYYEQNVALKNEIIAMRCEIEKLKAEQEVRCG